MSTRWSILGFFAIFVGLMVLFYAITTRPAFRSDVFPFVLDVNARTSAAVLRLLGESTAAVDQNVVSPRYALQIRRGCDGLEPLALFVAAALALPVSWRRRLVGAALGLVGLFILNQIRIVSLYYVGIHSPGAFRSVHVDVWQPLFVFLAMILWLAWAQCAMRPPPSVDHAQA